MAKKPLYCNPVIVELARFLRSKPDLGEEFNDKVKAALLEDRPLSDLVPDLKALGLSEPKALSAIAEIRKQANEHLASHLAKSNDLQTLIQKQLGNNAILNTKAKKAIIDAARGGLDSRKLASVIADQVVVNKVKPADIQKLDKLQKQIVGLADKLDNPVNATKQQLLQAEMSAIVAEYKPLTTTEQLISGSYSVLLGDLSTIFANVLGGVKLVPEAIVDLARYTLSDLTGLLRQDTRPSRTVAYAQSIGKAFSEIRNTLNLAKDASILGARGIRVDLGEASGGNFSNIPQARLDTFANGLGWYFEAPRRLFLSGSQAIEMVLYQSSRVAEAYRLQQLEGVARPTAAILKASEDAGLEAIMRNRTALGNALQKAKQGLEKIPVIGKFASAIMLPFTGVPSAITTWGIVDYSPSGFIVGLVQAAKEGRLSDKTTQRLFSSVIGSLGYYAAADYLLNSGILIPPADSPEELTRYEEAGIIAGSLKIGDTSIDLKRLEPASTPLLLASRVYRYLKIANMRAEELGDDGQSGLERILDAFFKAHLNYFKNESSVAPIIRQFNQAKFENRIEADASVSENLLLAATQSMGDFLGRYIPRYVKQAGYFSRDFVREETYDADPAEAQKRRFIERNFPFSEPEAKRQRTFGGDLKRLIRPNLLAIATEIDDELNAQYGELEDLSGETIRKRAPRKIEGVKVQREDYITMQTFMSSTRESLFPDILNSADFVGLDKKDQIKYLKTLEGALAKAAEFDTYAVLQDVKNVQPIHWALINGDVNLVLDEMLDKMNTSAKRAEKKEDIQELLLDETDSEDLDDEDELL